MWTISKYLDISLCLWVPTVVCSEMYNIYQIITYWYHFKMQIFCSTSFKVHNITRGVPLLRIWSFNG